MFSWIGNHFFLVFVIVMALLFGRQAFHWILKSSSKSNQPTIFCDKCGWKGVMLKSKRSCNRCGSPKITVRTS